MNRALAFLFTALLAHTAGAVCITDDTGTKICLDAPPRRAVSLYGAFTETVVALGSAASLVARTKNDDLPEVARLPSVGTGLRPNVEYLMALRPDLVLSRSGKAAEEALAALRARGLPAAAFDPASVDGVSSAIERIAILWGKGQEGKRLVEKIRGDLARVEKRAAGAGRRLRVVYEVRAEPLTVAGSGGLVDELIRAAGAENAVRAPKKLLAFDPEALLAANPDAYIVQVGPMNRKPIPPRERAGFQALRAVRQGKVFTVEEDLFARPGPHVAEATEQLSRLLYPELWTKGGR